MRRRVPLLALIPLLALSGIAAPSVAAAAYDAPTISTLDTSTAGHVSGSVATDAPFVRIELIASDYPAAIAPAITTANGSPTAFDFDTSGWTRVRVRATTCTSSDDCTGTSTVSAIANVSTVGASVTWPSDTTIGTDNTDYTITVDDNGEGGNLQVRWRGYTQAVPHHGTVDLMPLLQAEGSSTLQIERCSTTLTWACTSAGPPRAISVWRTFTPDVYAQPGAISPDQTSAPDLTGRFNLGVSGAAVTFAYGVRTPGNDTPVRTGSTAAVQDGYFHDVSIDLTGLPDGLYLLDGTFSFPSPNYGTISGKNLNHMLVTVDGTAPVVSSVQFTRSTLYPQPDGYQDTVDFRAVGDGVDTSLASAQFEILDSSGNVVSTSTSVPPTGLTGAGGTWAGDLVSSGSFTVRVTVKDGAGNTTVRTGSSITMSQKKLTWVTESRTVTAKASKVGQTVGRCSVVKTPSLHKWAGSLGLYSGSKCAPKAAAGKVTTVHRLRLPAAFAFGSARISLTGAAARTKATSTVAFGWRTAGGAWDPMHVASRTNGLHRGPGQAIARLRTSSNDLYWRAFAQRGSRYDVRSFTITYDYRTLR